MSDNGENDADVTVRKSRRPSGKWQFFSKFFNGLNWLTERIIGLLRSLVTAAMFLVVAFVIYNAWESRNTVAVKPFQVPVSMESNHAQSGRIIANLLNRHMLDAQNNLQGLLNPESGGIDLNNPVSAEQQVLIEGESIKLPETGITIDNVIEFISGIFGRKNLNGSVYYEAELNNTKAKLHMQITLRGRIISFSEDDLRDKRKQLPDTQSNGLNMQLISAMLEAHSKKILSIASEDYNLYYYCTGEIPGVEHDNGEYESFFDYCRDLQSADLKPKSLQALLASLEEENEGKYNKNIVGSVLTYLKKEGRQRHATLCQSKANRSEAACAGISIADAKPLAKARAVETVAAVAVRRPRASANTSGFSGAFVGSSSNITSMLRTGSVGDAIMLDSMRALEDQCDYLRTEAEDAKTGAVPKLERQCFASNPAQQAPVPLGVGLTAGPAETLQANQAESYATQLLRNGLYEESLVKYQASISLNCNNAVAWANMGILLSTASKESGVQDHRQAQCALLRATKLNEGAGWMRHSLCVAQAKQATGDLERFLRYKSCELARELEPINEALYDKLFYIDIADHYRELKAYEPARDAYVQAMKNEKTRSCSMKKVVQSLFELEAQGVSESRAKACRVFNNSVAAPEDVEEIPECEAELKQMVAQDCV